MKRTFTYIGVVLIMLFSFYYTNMAALFLRNNDELMISIKNVSYMYEEPVYNAIINDDTIIPGLSGKKIDYNKSYNNMKRTGFVTEDELVFSMVEPVVSIKDNYDKYIIQGNENKKSVALVFTLIDDSFLSSITKILNENNITATFFVETNFATDNKELLKELNNSFEIEPLGKNSAVTKNNLLYDISLIELITGKAPLYCFSKYASTETLNSCSAYNMYTIRPTILTGNYPLNKIKDNLKNGAIISFDMSSIVKKELSVSINYIKQKGYSFETLSSLLNEDEK